MAKTRDEEKLVSQISSNLGTSAYVETTLSTDERVLARITDGIYRQPASAIRELIANAYDADATQVYIQTDEPLFRTISVRDDGVGLTIEQLSRLIHHIGGSSKRTAEGQQVGVTSASDPTRSPGGRRLIGKIGIGLFSVSQLTNHFQIITKTKGTNYRLVAEVGLQQYREDGTRLDGKSPAPGTNDPAAKRTPERFRSGTVRIHSVVAVDTEAHGTEILLLELRPQARALLQSQDLWTRIDTSPDDAEGPVPGPPAFHIARVDQKKGVITSDRKLPWAKGDPPSGRFPKLYQGIVDQVGEQGSTPTLDRVTDNYLKMLWTLSLSAPLAYIDKHPFDLAADDEPLLFRLDNRTTGAVSELKLKTGQTLRKALSLRAPELGQSKFQVFVDDIELLRPLRFRDLPETSQAIQTPLVFVGADKPDWSMIDPSQRGGDLEFEAYFLMAPKVVPKDHNGLLIRINDASGTGFDDTFLRFQIAENMRLRQLSAEVFVHKGLDPALNIDRESFNYAHPHFQYLSRWVHRALRQIFNTHKSLASGVRDQRRAAAKVEEDKEIRKVVADAYASAKRKAEPAVVVFASGDEAKASRRSGRIALDPQVVLAGPRGSPPMDRRAAEANKPAVEAIAQVLEAFGVLDEMPYERQQELIRALATIMMTTQK